VGIGFTKRHDSVTVTDVFDGSPAARAGIRLGDRLLAVDGAGTENLTWMAIAGRLAGEPGSSIVLTIAAPHTTSRDVTLERQAFVRRDVESRALGEGIALVTVTRLRSETAVELRRVVEAAETAALILDLRNAGGGYWESAVEVASLFLPKGALVAGIERAAKGPEAHPPIPPVTHYYASGDRPMLDRPMVVLIGAHTAGSFEIVAAALKHNGRATAVGEPSAGLGAIESLFIVGERLAIRVPTGMIVQPSGKPLASDPVLPDVAVARDDGSPDAPLDRAVRGLRDATMSTARGTAAARPPEHPGGTPRVSP
jgi:carboxyl-terminal processing protease